MVRRRLLIREDGGTAPGKQCDGCGAERNRFGIRNDPCPQEDLYDELGCYELHSTSKVGLELLTMPSTSDLRQDWCSPTL